MAFELYVIESYADALVNVAEESGRLDDVLESARELADYLETHEDRRLRVFIESPQVPDHEKHGLIRSMFEGRVDPLLVRLACLMISKRRSLYVAPTLRRFCEQVDEKRNVFSGIVRTAHELSDEEKERIKGRLEEFTGATLRLRFRAEPDLIGGIVFKYRDVLIDSTLRAGLNEIRARLDDLRIRLEPPPVEVL